MASSKHLRKHLRTSSKMSGCSGIQKERNKETECSTVWAPLIHEISSLVDTLHDLDNDETKSTDTIVGHTERIKSAIPPNPTAIWYPQPIHQLLSAHPFKRIEIPLDVLELLVSSDFDVNEYNEERITGLHLAIKNRHYNAARWLVQHGADCEKGSFYTVDNYWCITPIAMLARHRDAPLDMFNLLKTPKNFTHVPKSPLPLHVAAENGHIETVHHLIKLGASVNQEDAHGIRKRLPLHRAVANGHTEVALSLIKLGASVNQEDGCKNRPLHIALGEGHIELALSLIKLGASVNQTDRHLDLPLNLAVKKGHTELALSLIKLGASVNQEDGCLDLPLHLAVKKGHTELAQTLIKLGASVNEEDGCQNLLLHSAVEEGRIELALSLIKLGASVNQKNGLGNWPLHLAVEKGHTELALSLIKLGASVNQKNRLGNWPLHLAVEKGHTELALSLIKHGASVNQTNEYNCLPIAHYLKFNSIIEHYNDNLFTRLMPESNTDILSIICKIFQEMDIPGKNIEQHVEILSNMLHKLIQRLILVQPFSVTVLRRIKYAYRTVGQYIVTCMHMKLDGKDIDMKMTVKGIYLCSVLLILLGCDVSFNSSVTEQSSLTGRAIENIQDACNQIKGVKRLQTLCIHKIRQSMHSLTDESFHSLPIPYHLGKLLMLHDVADVVCKAFQSWPELMPIEQLM